MMTFHRSITGCRSIPQDFHFGWFQAKLTKTEALAGIAMDVLTLLTVIITGSTVLLARVGAAARVTGPRESHPHNNNS